MFINEVSAALDCGEFLDLEIKKSLIDFLTKMDDDLTNLKYGMSGDVEESLIALRKKFEDLDVVVEEEVIVVVDETPAEIVVDPTEVELDDDDDDDDDDFELDEDDKD